MLSRTLSRQGTQSGPQRWRPIAKGTLIAGALVGLYLLLPRPAPTMRIMPTDQELPAHLTRMLAPPAATNSATKKRAALGQRLFHDSALSQSGTLACASCHDPEKAYTDGAQTAKGLAPLGRHTPSLVNSYLDHWFMWDGRADSLTSAVLQSLEDPRQHGISRVHVARVILERHADAYIEAFGSIPEALRLEDLPPHGLPAEISLTLPDGIAAQTLATLGSYELLSEVLLNADAARRAPAREISIRVLETAANAPPPFDWIARWEAMSPALQTAVERVYINVGLALAEHIGGLVAIDSPFDRFATRVMTGIAVTEALSTEFGETELAGLKLYLGPARCVLCHGGPNLNDQQFHNVGLGARDATVDIGRAAGIILAKADPFNCLNGKLSKLGNPSPSESCRELPWLDENNPDMIGAFKTPSLRNVAQTAPYGHDGRFKTLAEVIEHYSALADRPALGRREGTLKPLDLSASEKKALLAFLKSLSSPIRNIHDEEQIGLRP